MNILIIGDAHFSEKNILDMKIVENDILSILSSVDKLDMIVGLGDWMNDFGKISLKSYTACLTFILKMVDKCDKFVMLIGNHDRVNNRYDPENLHIFSSLKTNPKILVVDEPFIWEQGGVKFGAIPYLPADDFNGHIPPEFFDGSVRLCFAHQEFRGCILSANTCSTEGTEVTSTTPTTISGHIHMRHNIGRVYYPGTPIQHNFSEGPDKSVTACFVHPATPDQQKSRDFVEEPDGSIQAQEGTIILQNLLLPNIPKKYTIYCDLVDLPKYIGSLNPKDYFRFIITYNLRDELITSQTYMELRKNSRVKVTSICREVVSKLNIPVLNKKSFRDTIIAAAKSEDQRSLLFSI